MARQSASTSAIPSPAQAGPYPTHSEVVRNLGASACEAFAKAVTGTGADLDVTLPFDPAYVEIWNLTQLAVFRKFPSQAGVVCVKQVTAGTLSNVAANGVTLGSKKITLGSGVHAGADALHIVAFGFPENGGS